MIYLLPQGWSNAKYSWPNRKYLFHSRFKAFKGKLYIHYSIPATRAGIDYHKDCPAQVDVAVYSGPNSMVFRKVVNARNGEEIKEIQNKFFEEVSRKFYKE